MMKIHAQQSELPFLKQLGSSPRFIPGEPRRVRFKRVIPDFAKPNWTFNAAGICCRLDWEGTAVYRFDEAIDRDGIIAYSYEHAVETFLRLKDQTRV